MKKILWVYTEYCKTKIVAKSHYVFTYVLVKKKCKTNEANILLKLPRNFALKVSKVIFPLISVCTDGKYCALCMHPDHACRK